MRCKKIIFFILLAFIGIGSIKAETATVEYIDGIYSNRIGDDQVYSGKMGFLIMNGEVVYCLEPYLIIGQEYVLNNDYFNHFSKEDIEYFELVAGSVREQVNNRNIYYYMAAQELIWERIIGDKVYWTTEKNGDVEIDIASYKEEINNYVDHFYTKPSFDGIVVSEDYSNEIILEDLNGVLSDYQIVGETISTVHIIDNKLYIKVLSNELEDIVLRRNNNGTNSNYYHSSSNQDLSDLSGNVNLEAKITIQVNKHDASYLSINFYDREYSLLIEDEIRFKIHNLDTDEYSDELITYNGKFESDFVLECGHYELILTHVPPNFYIDKNEYFEIIDNIYSNYYQINVLLESARGRLIINNYSNNTNYNIFAAEDVYNIYGDLIFSKDSLIGILDIPQNSDYQLELPFGTYYVLNEQSKKKYYFDLKYKDQFTKSVIYVLDIYETIDNEEKGETDQPKDPEVTDEEKEKIDDLKETMIDDKSDDDVINIEHDLGDSNIIANQKNNSDLKTLPNTYDYIGIMKFIFEIMLIGSIIPLKFRKND